KPVCRIAALAALLLSTTLFAQTAAPARPVGSIAGHTGWPVAKAEDVKSPEAILNAVYSVISGGKGQARGWDRMRSLFVPDPRLIPAVAGSAADGGAGHRDLLMLSLGGRVERSGCRLLTDGCLDRSFQ